MGTTLGREATFMRQLITEHGDRAHQLMHNYMSLFTLPYVNAFVVPIMMEEVITNRQNQDWVAGARQIAMDIEGLTANVRPAVPQKFYMNWKTRHWCRDILATAYQLDIDELEGVPHADLAGPL